MEKLASVSIDEKEQIYLNGKLLENVVAYKLENSASSKEPAKLTVTMFVNVGHGCCATSKESLDRISYVHSMNLRDKEASGRLDWDDALKRVIEVKTTADQYSHNNH